MIINQYAFIKNNPPPVVIINPTGEHGSSTFFDLTGNHSVQGVGAANITESVLMNGYKTIAANGGFLSLSPTSVFSFLNYLDYTIKIRFRINDLIQSQYCVLFCSATNIGSRDGFFIFYEKYQGVLYVYRREQIVLQLIIPIGDLINSFNEVALYLGKLNENDQFAVSIRVNGIAMATAIEQETVYRNSSPCRMRLSTDKAFFGGHDMYDNGTNHDFWGGFGIWPYFTEPIGVGGDYAPDFVPWSA